MEEKFSEYQELLLEKFLPSITDKERGLLFCLGAGPKEYGFESEMLEYLKSHPNTTLLELEKFAEQFSPEIVIEDDEDED